MAFGIVSAILCLLATAMGFTTGNLLTHYSLSSGLGEYAWSQEFRSFVWKPIGVAILYGSIPCLVLGVIYGLVKVRRGTE